MIWVIAYNDGRIEASFTEGGSVQDAKIRFRFASLDNFVTEESVEIPVTMLLDMAKVLELSLEAHKLKLESDIKKMKENQNGKED
jgi:5-hydroxyisourate hydrolase-like protein (transthyretin family)